MKKLKIFLSVILIMVFTILNLDVSAYVVDGVDIEEYVKNDGTWYYTLDEESKTATIYAYNGDDTNVVIPEIVEEEYKVTCLELTTEIFDKYGLPMDFPVFDKKIETLTIPKTLESISSRIRDRYYNPNGYNYENDVLEQDDKKIMDGYFLARGLYNLEAINVEDDNPYFSSANGVLYNKNKTVLIFYPECKKDEKYTVPNTVTKIMDNAFYGMSLSLKEIVITENVSVLGEDNDIFNDRKTGIERVTILNNILGENHLSRMFSNDVLDLTYIDKLGFKGITVTVYKDSPAHKYYSERKNLVVLDNPYIEKEEEKTESKKEERKKETSSKTESAVSKPVKTESKKGTVLDKTETSIPQETSKTESAVSQEQEIAPEEVVSNTSSQENITGALEQQETDKEQNNVLKIIIPVAVLLILGGGIAGYLLIKRKKL